MIARAAHFLSNSVEDIRSCTDLRDKLAVATSSTGRVLTMAVNRVAQTLRNNDRDIIPNYVALFRNVRIVNGDGVFHCRKRTSDYAIARFDYERALRRYFTLEAGTFVDVGAHIGKYAIKLARELGHRGQVVAIEPDPSSFEILSKNIELNRLKNVHAINLACWDSKIELPLYLDSCEPIKHSLTIHSGRSVSVNARPLDEILEELGIFAVDLLKVDAEGADLRVLRGASETLKRSPRLKIILEGSEPEPLHLLSELGFGLTKTDHRFGREGCYYVAQKPRRAS